MIRPTRADSIAAIAALLLALLFIGVLTLLSGCGESSWDRQERERREYQRSALDNYQR